MLGSDFRPINRPEAPRLFIARLEPYQRFIYGMSKAAAIVYEGVDEKAERRPIRERRSRGGVELPPGVDDPVGP